METLSDPTIYATTDLIEYPFGGRLWHVESSTSNLSLTLNLNSCDDFDSFSCNDGACISIEDR